VALADPPGEVAEMIGNPACEIEKLFNVLKFQISHYKKIITTVNQKVQCLQKEKQTLQRYIIRQLLFRVHLIILL
jgi:hypothetical protein